MVEELSSGPCVAMEIVAKDKSHNTAVEFRKLVGPSDPVRFHFNMPLFLCLVQCLQDNNNVFIFLGNRPIITS